MVHGIDENSAMSCTAGEWGNPRGYLQASGGHPGLGSDQIHWTGPIYLIGYYNGDWDCDAYISTHNNPHGNFSGASSCNGVSKQGGGSVGNSDSSVGTNAEPIEHIACELSWYIWDHFAQYGANVKIVAHSMGGLIVRYMIERVQAGDSHFAYFLDISDIVTFSTPHGGITDAQMDVQAFQCGGCYESSEMAYDLNWGNYSAFMTDVYNHDHPNAAYGTDWTMIGSLGLNDPLDWDFQATYMSNSGGLSNNHRIGYDSPIKCNGSTEYSNGYGHGDYMSDGCDAYDAPYYYCDGCSRSKSSWFSYTTGAPHSLHEMLFAFVYSNW